MKELFSYLHAKVRVIFKHISLLRVMSTMLFSTVSRVSRLEREEEHFPLLSGSVKCQRHQINFTNFLVNQWLLLKQ